MTPRVPDLAPGEFHEVRQTIKRSLFITRVARVRNVDEAKAFVDRIKAMEPTATHNCWAYVANPAGQSTFVGMSDDGEPKGTAGRPMLSVLMGSGVGEIACVITRYYGGILLGTGGLVHAYGSGVRLALESLPTVEDVPTQKVMICASVTDADRIQNTLQYKNIPIVQQDVGLDAAFVVRVPPNFIPELETLMAELTNGDAFCEVLEDDEA